MNIPKEVSLPDLPISKSTPFRTLYFLKRAKAGPSKLLPARRETINRNDIQDFVMNRDRLWTEIHNFSPLFTTGFVNKPTERDLLNLKSTGCRVAQYFTNLPGSTGQLIGRLSQIVWKIQRTVPQPGLPAGTCGEGTPHDTGGTPIVQEFLPSSPSKKVRTSFKTFDITGLLSFFGGSPFFILIISV